MLNLLVQNLIRFLQVHQNHRQLLGLELIQLLQLRRHHQIHRLVL